MDSTNNIIQITELSVDDLCKSVAQRLRLRRLELDLTQKGLAERAGVNVETYRRFERTGEISFKNMAKLSIALGMSADLSTLFNQKQYGSLDELLNSKTKKIRKRGSRE